MAITPDKLAALQLLVERGQSYSDIARVLGVDEGEIRTRARTALTELGGADPDRNVGLTDYLLGQADPIGRAEVSRHLREDPADHALATALCEQLHQLYPTAELPRLPGEPRRARRPRRRSEAGRGTGVASRLAGLSRSQTRLIVALGSGALLLIVIVLAIAGVFSNGEGEATAGDTTTTAAPPEGEPIPITLEPVQGSDAGGVIVFGFASADQPFIEFQVRRLEPPSNETAYVLWFLTGDGEGFPLPTPLPVQDNGSLNERIPIPAEILGFVRRARSVAIALNDRQELNRAIQRAVREGAGSIAFPGGTVLSAKIRRGSGGGGGGGGSGGDSG